MGGGATELTGPDLAAGVAFDELTEGTPLLGHAGGEAVVVVRVGDDVHAIGASCTHYGGPLAQGLVVGDTIRCPWHHACFDLKTGEAIGAPALPDNACYETARAGALVQVRTKKDAPKRKLSKSAAKSAPKSIVVIGAGAAGAACVEMLRKQGYAGTITMIGAEEPGPVDRPNLSKDYLAGTAPEEWIPLGSRERYAELKVELLPSTPVTSIDAAAKKVTLEGGRTITYDALLLATGGEPSRLPIEGGTLPHVHTLRSLADSRGIIENAKTAKRAVVIGTSFIGLEVAASLVARGLEVHVVGPEPVPLARALGEALGAHVQKLHESKGVKFHLGTTPKAITETAVLLAKGDPIEADLVVLGVGVKPRVALAEAAGLKVDNGVVVDERLRTSAAGIWAAGDIARYPDPRASDLVRIEHWVVAERQGQHVARAMLGSEAPYLDTPFFWSVHYDVTINYVGHAPGYESVEVFGSIASNDAAIAFRKGGKTLAVATLNRDKLSLALDAAMARNDLAAVDGLLPASRRSSLGFG
jgi:NADPH-dependent 2,4-dienoyl-CoA reductase/sulfur reductase-like enzyme/nitrite reductase/ring-hydroxylating ferredoxin subunit